MISRVIKKTVELNKIQKVDQLEGPLYQLENAGHTFEITCLMNGAAADISGTVSGRFLRADETTVYFTGTLSGNVASITLPQSCYNVNGRFGFVVFISGSDVTTAIYAVAGSVYKSTSDTIIDPTGEIPSLEELLAEIDACEAATAAATAASAFVPNVIAPAYSASATYAVGDYVTKDNYLYQCNTAISTAEAWTAAHWTQVKVGGELSDLKSALNTLMNGKIEMESGTFTDATGTVKVSMTSRLRTVNPLNAGTIGLIEIADGYEAYGFLLDSSMQKIGTLAWSSIIRQSSVASAAYINLAIRKIGATSQDISADVAVVENGTTLYSTQQIDIDDAKARVNGLFSVAFSENGYIDTTGNNSGTSSSFKRTDYIPLSGVRFGIEYALCLADGGNIVSYYDVNKSYLGGVVGGGNSTVKSGMLTYPDTAEYVRFSCCVASGGVTNPDPVVRLKDIVQYSSLGSTAVKAHNIDDNAVTRRKCNFIIHDPATNYINKADYTNGYINSSGDFVPNNGWRATGFCALLPETKYFSGGLHGGYCAFYKADKTTVIAAYGAYAFTVTEFTTPAETAYARFSLNAESQSVDNAWINIKNEKPEDYGYILDGVGVSSNVDNPCDYDGMEIAVFNKILCVGDSMTEGTFNHLDSGTTQYVNYAKYSYPTYLHKMTGVDVTNLGHGGQTSVQWYNTEQSSDLSGYDCAIIQLGINDYGTYGELGADTKTAFQNIITKLKTENKNIKIFVANIIPATSYSSDGYKAFSAALLEWLETTYASDPSVIPVDIQQYGHTGNSEAYNAGHLTALGYRMLARDYIGFISNYIKDNGGVFREVQFIGTNYWYVNPNS